MAKYRPESRRNLEKRVKDISHKAKDRTEHMSNVKKEAKVISDVSKKIKPAGTIEAGNDIKKALHVAGELIRLEFKRWREALENVVKESRRTETEFRERIKYSRSNYEELTHASNSIKETPAARDKINQGRRYSQEDMNISKVCFNTLRGIRQGIQDRSYRLDAETSLQMVLNEGDGKGDWAEFVLNPQEIKDIVEEHLMDVELRGPVPAKGRRRFEKIDDEQ